MKGKVKLTAAWVCCEVCGWSNVKVPLRGKFLALKQSADECWCAGMFVKSVDRNVRTG